MYAKNFLNQVGEVKSKETKEIFDEVTKGTMVGAAIGAGIGIYIGLSRHKNLLLSAFIGAAIGGGISRVFIIKK